LQRFIKDAFDAFPECGILAHGFLRLRCGERGHDALLALSCKRREDPDPPGLSADARSPLRTTSRLAKGPSSARARPARLDPQPPPRGPAREAGQD
jgi:hypothetical protein